MSASTIALFRIVAGPSGPKLWSAAQYHSRVYFTVRPNGPAVTQDNAMRVEGVPVAIRTNPYGPSLLTSFLGIELEATEAAPSLEGKYDTSNKGGGLTCDIRKARLDWLGVDMSVASRLAEHGLSTVDDALACHELTICRWLIGDPMGNPTNSQFAQQAVKLFTELRDRLTGLDRELRFKGVRLDEQELFTSL